MYKLRMQHSWGAAENHFFEQYADIIREMSGGRIDIAVFSDGELVSMDELCDAVAAGTIDIGHTHPDYYSGVVPEGYLESAPYLWRTLDEEMAVIEGYGIGDIYAEAFEERYGYHVIGFEPDDDGALMFTREINSLADMKGCVINVCDPYASILAELAGSSATYMGPEELYTSLALGVIDGVEYGGAKSMSAMGFHEVAKYYLEPVHQIAYFPFYFINMNLWNELSPDLQAILTEGVNANGYYMKSFYAYGETKALAMMREAGVKICYLPDEDVEAIFEKAVEWLTEDYAPMSPGCARAANICLEALRDFGYID
jgi:TRAP-type C4-dicarboxylate transport system substrate-binding protein